jgi:hypothetical protein
MSALLNKIANDDFLWDAIASHLPKFRRSATQFFNFNCPICLDYKPRCGIKRSNRIGINCYNCGFATEYKVGGPLSKNMRQFLARIGVSDLDIKRLNLHATAVKRALEQTDYIPDAIMAISFEPNFQPMNLPESSLTLMEWAEMGCTDEHYLQVVEYAISRGEVLMENAEFRWSPDERYKDRVIIPFYWRNKIVGYTARTVLVEEKNKYLNYMPQDFLFNNRVLDLPERQFALLVEGPLDAIAVDGVSPLGSKLNEKQTAWLNGSGKKVVVVPDRDAKGQIMIDIARKNNWSVAFPGIRSNHQSWWDDDLKDCAAAVNRHGRLYVLKSILATATNKGTEIEVKRRYLV